MPTLRRRAGCSKSLQSSMTMPALQYTWPVVFSASYEASDVTLFVCNAVFSVLAGSRAPAQFLLVEGHQCAAPAVGRPPDKALRIQPSIGISSH